MKPVTAESTAHHEAGHAVIAIRLGVPLRWVARDGDGSGQVRHAPCDPEPEIKLCLAGPLAEARFREIRIPANALLCGVDGDDGDDAQVKQLAAELCDSKNGGYILFVLHR